MNPADLKVIHKNILLNISVNMVEYYIDEDKRTVVAVLTIEETGAIYKGKAKCDPNDKFNQEIGETLARMRALRKWKKSEVREALSQYCYARSAAYRAQSYAKDKLSKLKNIEKWLDDYLKKV